jgi:putative transposase
MLTVVTEDGSTRGGSLIDGIVREGAGRMLAAALEAEIHACIAELTDERDERGRRFVVRNGHHRPRNVTTVAGTVEVKAPRVNDKRIDEEAKRFLGSSAGLSPATVPRLTTQWQAGHKAFGERDMSATDCVYVWADGIHLRIRLEEAKAAVLVVMGVRADGTKELTKELIAMADGYRESAESRASVPRDATRRGIRAPVLAVGDGALGFWNALHEVFPETRRQRSPRVGFTRRPTSSTACPSRTSPR